MISWGLWGEGINEGESHTGQCCLESACSSQRQASSSTTSKAAAAAQTTAVDVPHVCCVATYHASVTRGHSSPPGGRCAQRPLGSNRAYLPRCCRNDATHQRGKAGGKRLDDAHVTHTDCGMGELCDGWPELRPEPQGGFGFAPSVPPLSSFGRVESLSAGHDTRHLARPRRGAGAVATTTTTVTKDA